MSWVTQTFSSSIGKKIIMSLTGLFLISFLAVHVSGNMLLFQNDQGEAFNIYTEFMTHNPFIKTVSYILYASILIHVIYSLILSINNRKSRPVGYAKANPSANSVWASRNMGILGTIILIFLLIHMKSFWYGLKFGNPPMVTYPEEGEVKNMYIIVEKAFSQWWYVALYVAAMIGLAFHLSHGFVSAFQTLGLQHKKYTPFIKKLGIAFSIIVSLLFASMPIYIYIRSLG